MTLQIYNIKIRLSSILINIFTRKVKFIDTKIDSDKRVIYGGWRRWTNKRTNEQTNGALHLFGVFGVFGVFDTN